MSPGSRRHPAAPHGERAAKEVLHELLRRTHLSSPADLAGVVADQAASSIDAQDIVLYLADYDEEALMPLPGTGANAGQPVPVTGTIAGRAFSATDIVRIPDEASGRERWWVPLLDGTERVGVMTMTFAHGGGDGLLETVERYAHLVAMLIVTKGAYGDVFERTRRRQPMTLASELLWSLAPPMVFATDRLVIAGMLEPSYDNGGDALDYAADGDVLHLGVFDAMGHGLPAAGVAAFAVAAYRHSRRRGCSLEETHAAMDAAVETQFPEHRFVTALIAQLDLEQGRLQCVSAGHPPPLLLRGGRWARSLDVQPVPPLGVGLRRTPVATTEWLEPDDLLLLYTDGLTEARDASGSLLGVEGLSEFIEREAFAGQTTPETLRRLRNAIKASPRSRLRDDATALLLEWRRGGERALLPPTVL